MKLSPKYPLFAGRTVRESRRAEAEYYKDHPDSGSRPLTSMSYRQVKKLWAKQKKGLPPHGARERKLTNYFIRIECEEVDRNMLANAY